MNAALHFIRAHPVVFTIVGLICVLCAVFGGIYLVGQDADRRTGNRSGQ